MGFYNLNSPAFLLLADGSIFRGKSVGYDGSVVGEVVFNTSMTGYQEIITDPSYLNQLICFTHPHIGNVGVNEQDFESQKVCASGVIVRDSSFHYSNVRGKESLGNFLKRKQIIAISGIDTRRLTRLIRIFGAQAGSIWAGPDIGCDQNIQLAQDSVKSFSGLSGLNLAKAASVDESYFWRDGSINFIENSLPISRSVKRWNVIAYDLGIKSNILRLLVDRGCEITVVPYKTSTKDVLAMSPDGIFLSNGPGDPKPCTQIISSLKVFLTKKIPLFGICLGHQLLALASGALTHKMKFGHHGANHPVIDLKTGRVIITSQNHGFTVDESSLPNNLKVTHRSLFDRSLQGIMRTDAPAYSFQGHPEASPGPREANSMFDKFISMMQENDAKKN